MATEQQIVALKKQLSRQLLTHPGVNGVGVESDGAGNYFLAIHVDNLDRPIVKQPPPLLTSQPFKFVSSGPFVKFHT
jgi:hypothetical protein